MRILVIGNAGEREPGRRYSNVERKLANGFIRNGHSVWFFSDRDVARASTWLRSSRVGRAAANAKLIEAVRNYAPHAIVFAHSCLIATSTFAEIKQFACAPKLGQICVDPLFRTVNVKFLSERAAVTDATFVTTAGSALKRFSTASNVSAFIPNPVDASVEDRRNFARSDLDFDVFFAANASRDRLDDVRRETPRRFLAEPGLTCSFHGFGGAPGLYGADYFERLGQARMGLNLNSDRGETAPSQAPEDELYLYSSDRLAQLVGCGLLTLSLRVNRLDQLFYDGREMAFADGPETLCELALKYKRDDAARRAIAEAGWRKAHAAYSERLVAQFIEETLFRRAPGRDYAWPTTLW